MINAVAGELNCCLQGDRRAGFLRQRNIKKEGRIELDIGVFGILEGARIKVLFQETCQSSHRR